MLNYHPKKQMYPGDKAMQAVASMTKVARGKSNKCDGDPVVLPSQLKKVKRHGNSRLCGSLDKLCNHVKSIMTVKKGLPCLRVVWKDNLLILWQVQRWEWETNPSFALQSKRIEQKTNYVLLSLSQFMLRFGSELCYQNPWCQEIWLDTTWQAWHLFKLVTHSITFWRRESLGSSVRHNA